MKGVRLAEGDPGEPAGQGTLVWEDDFSLGLKGRPGVKATLTLPWVPPQNSWACLENSLERAG